MRVESIKCQNASGINLLKRGTCITFVLMGGGGEINDNTKLKQ